MMESQQKKIQNQVLHGFLMKMRQQKTAEIERLRRQLDTVESDLAIAERRLRDTNDQNAIVPDNDAIPNELSTSR